MLDNLSKRKKRGIALLVSGLAFIAAGIITGWFPAVSTGLQTVLAAVGAVGNVLGFTFVFPDIQDEE